ncbi:hypothetical protein RFI_31131, partial [Reticulomyxa filosa]
CLLLIKQKKMKQAHCLKLFLKNNNNSCPIQSHDIKCDFRGKLKDLNNHLINECNLNLIDRNHIRFNHNLNGHHISTMKLPFDLVTQLLQSMRQEIELKNNLMKQIERDFQQDQADIEIIIKSFNDKEKQ